MKMARNTTPAIDVEKVRRISPHPHGTTMGGLTAFQGLAFGATGRVTGLLTDNWDVASCS